MAQMQPSRYPIISVEEALALVLQNAQVVETEEIKLGDCYGRVLADRIVAHENQPSFVSSAVDGYAVSGKDRSQRRRVLSEITAGVVERKIVRPGEATRIMTGSPLPQGADTVVMVEDTAENDGFVTINRLPNAGDNAHPIGLDIKMDQKILVPGVVLGPAEIGLLATLGVSTLSVYRKPRVAILATGDELVDYTQEPSPGSIRDSNRPSLLAAVIEAGCEPLSLGIGRDDEGEQRSRIEAGLASADVLVTSGGVSVGSRDLIKPIFESLGDIHVGRVAIKPGKPFTFATIYDKLAFGLPGFPVSTLVTFEVFVRPALLKLAGRTDYLRPTVKVRLEHDVRPAPDRIEYQRAVVRWNGEELVARTTGAQVSSRLLSMIGANALVIVPRGEAVVKAGEKLPALLTNALLADNN